MKAETSNSIPPSLIDCRHVITAGGELISVCLRGIIIAEVRFSLLLAKFGGLLVDCTRSIRVERAGGWGVSSGER